MFDKKELWQQIKTVLSAMDFRRSMMVLIGFLVLIPSDPDSRKLRGWGLACQMCGDFCLGKN
jgi:hypothetical protein